MTRDDFFNLPVARRVYLINKLHEYYNPSGRNFGEDPNKIEEDEVREFFLMQKKLTSQYNLDHPVVY